MRPTVEIIANTTDFYLEKETAAAIGKFDGIHIGHRRLLDEILMRRDRGLDACVFTFDPEPNVFFGGEETGELTTKEEKRLLFERMGVDVLIEFPLTAETASMRPGEFAAEVLAKRMNARFVAAGTDISFGAGGTGDAACLRELGDVLGFEVKIIDKVRHEGREVSSTYVRSQVEEGHMRTAEKLLGMPYLIAGKVTEGRQLGRKLGFPTVNLLPGGSKLMPPNGVYLSRVRHRGKLYRAVSNVGYKPTVTDERVLGVESYLYDFDGTIYGEEIEVYLCELVRPERKFESLEALQQCVKEDIAAGKAWDGL